MLHPIPFITFGSAAVTPSLYEIRSSENYPKCIQAIRFNLPNSHRQVVILMIKGNVSAGSGLELATSSQIPYT